MKKAVPSIRIGYILTLFLIAEFDAPAQARQPLSLVRVLYNAQKATVKPQGQLKEKIDALDQEIGEALRLGRTGMRGLLAKGIVLLSGREWTNELEFSTSLVVRAEEVCVDSGAPYAIRLEQIYAPRVEFASPLTASRVMVEMMKKLGVEHQYIEVPGGDHTSVVAPNIPAVFDFFDKHSKSGPSGRQPNRFESSCPAPSALTYEFHPYPGLTARPIDCRPSRLALSRTSD